MWKGRNKRGAECLDEERIRSGGEQISWKMKFPFEDGSILELKHE